MDCGLPGSSVHGIFQARVLEWVLFFRGSSWGRNWTQVSHVEGRFFTVWAIREAHKVRWKQVYLERYTFHRQKAVCVRKWEELWNVGCLVFMCVCVCVSRSVMSDSLWPSWGVRLFCPWEFPGQNTGVGCHFLLQGVLPTQGSNRDLLHCRWILYHLNHQGWVIS